MDEIQGKHVDLSIGKPEQLYRLAHALASPVRIRILEALGSRSMSVGELSETLNIPMSTTALAVKTLEEAGIITTETQPGARGSMKLCSRRLDTLSIQLEPEEEESNVLAQAIPLGGYSQAEGIMPTCGLASKEMIIGEMDAPGAVDFVCNSLPGRFPPDWGWILLPSLLAAAVVILSHALCALSGPGVRRMVDVLCGVLGCLGSASLYYLLTSNLVLFTLAGKRIAPALSAKSTLPWSQPIQAPLGAACWTAVLLAALGFVSVLAGRGKGHKTA